MGTVRTGTLAARPTEITNVTVTNPGLTGSTLLKLLSDRRTLIFRSFNGIATSTDYGATVTVRTNFLDSTWTVESVAETPAGELLVALTKSGQAGQVFRSTGWNGTTATSWAQVLTASGPNCIFRNEWSLTSKGQAPSWSRHAGAMFVSEYGPQADTAATVQQGAIRAWMSSDDGATWREIFNAVNQWAAQGYTHLHVHAIAYDPWAGRVVITQGDGAGANPGSCGVWWSANPEAATPTWNLIPGTNTTTSFEQVTTVLPTEAGLLLLPDGRPQGARLVPRRGAARYGTLRELVNMSGYNDGLVGSGLHRNGSYESPLPGHPILFTMLESSAATGYGYPALWVSNDGMQYRQLYRHGTAASNTAPGLQRIFGPTVDGKLVGWINLAGTGQVFLADYLPVAEKTATTATSTAIPVDVQTFTASGTWTKPAGVTTVRVQAIGGGGGGGSGRVSASGTVASGGAGGSGGGYTDIQLPASALGATETVTVGTGGSGGTAVTVDSTNGNAGTAGTQSLLGSKVRAGSGNQGSAGSTSAAAGNGGGAGLSFGQAGAGSSGSGAAGSSPASSTPYVAPAGGSGGGIATTPAAVAGGAGGTSPIPNALAGGTAGTSGGGVGGAGTSATANLPFAGSGGGGGGSAITGAAGAGGNGGSYGAGGGGGGAALNGQGGSGAGGNGAPGIVIVTSW